MTPAEHISSSLVLLEHVAHIHHDAYQQARLGLNGILTLLGDEAVKVGILASWDPAKIVRRIDDDLRGFVTELLNEYWHTKVLSEEEIEEKEEWVGLLVENWILVQDALDTLSAKSLKRSVA